MSHAVETEIRALVRELLRDIVPQSVIAPRGDSRQVRIVNDADLTVFASQVLDLARDPATERDIRSGAFRFELIGQGTGEAVPVVAPTQQAVNVTPAVAAPTPVLRIEKGAVTEKIIVQAAANGTRLVLGPRAVITPLAKEAARKNGVGIERSA